MNGIKYASSSYLYHEVNPTPEAIITLLNCNFMNMDRAKAELANDSSIGKNEDLYFTLLYPETLDKLKEKLEELNVPIDSDIQRKLDEYAETYELIKHRKELELKKLEDIGKGIKREPKKETGHEEKKAQETSETEESHEVKEHIEVEAVHEAEETNETHEIEETHETEEIQETQEDHDSSREKTTPTLPVSIVEEATLDQTITNIKQREQRLVTNLQEAMKKSDNGNQIEENITNSEHIDENEDVITTDEVR